MKKDLLKKLVLSSFSGVIGFAVFKTDFAQHMTKMG